jgi:hypothetical protein
MMACCSRCGESPLLVEIDTEKFFVRPVRATRCKNYRPSAGVMGSLICRSVILRSANAAWTNWNRMQLNPVAEGEIQQ